MADRELTTCANGHRSSVPADVVTGNLASPYRCPECGLGVPHVEPPKRMPNVLEDIRRERQRQIIKGYNDAHDDKHVDGEIALAAALYAVPYEMPEMEQDHYIRLHMMLDIAYEWNLPPEPDRRRRLVKAAAMLIAEIERLDRAALLAGERSPGVTIDAGIMLYVSPTQMDAENTAEPSDPLPGNDQKGGAE